MDDMVDDVSEDSEWWWIDYLENEFDASLEADLQMLLEHSQEDRNHFENFRILRQWLKESDPAFDWPVEARAPVVCQRVMQAISLEDDAARVNCGRLDSL